MGFYDFEKKYYEGAADVPTMDSPINDKVARAAVPPSPKGDTNSAKVIAEYSKKDRILSAEELMEHRKHCRAKPGNCPFEKARDEADDITPAQVHITKTTVFVRFASLLTQMFTMAKNLAKPALVDTEKLNAEADKAEVDADSAPKSKPSAPAQDAIPLAPSAEVQDDSQMVAEIIEKGIETMVEMAKSKGCTVTMDPKKSKYLVEGPKEGAAKTA